MAVEFDPKKNASNLRKHGVPLTEGEGVLNDPLAITLEDAASQGEQRWVTMGMNVFGTLCVVVYTQRQHSVRLISVRKTTSKERREYEKGI